VHAGTVAFPGVSAMRLVPSFHLSYPDVRALRIALASGAVAGLVVLAACTDNGGKAITAPSGLRNATIGSGGFGQAKTLTLCVDASSPSGTYTFHNIALNRGQGGPPPHDPTYTFALDGNGFYDGAYWNDNGDGGDGTTVANADVNVNYPVTPGPSGCVVVLNRTVGDAAFMAVLPINEGGTCDPNAQACGGKNDSFAAANFEPVSNTAGAVYDHTDCFIDDGTPMPQHINPTTGNPPVPTQPWPQCGFDHNNPPAYTCGSNNFVTRAFVNYEHGVTVTYAFHAQPVLTECTTGPDAGGAAAATYYGVSNARTTAAFNESEVLTCFGLTPGVLHGWYTDEHAETLGVDSIYVNNKNPTPDAFYGVSTSAAYTIATMAGHLTGPNPQITAGFAGSPWVPEGRVGTSSAPVGLGNAIDPAGRALRPGIYLTDLTVNGINSKIGDWQMGNDNPVAPTGVYGTWKGAIITIDNTKTPSVTSLVNRADPAKNHKVVGPGGTNPPAAAIDNGYSTDNQWNLSTLVAQGVMISGHAYRAQFIVHDGDQNKTGGDVGQACINVQM